MRRPDRQAGKKNTELNQDIKKAQSAPTEERDACASLYGQYTSSQKKNSELEREIKNLTGPENKKMVKEDSGMVLACPSEGKHVTSHRLVAGSGR